MLSVAFLSWWPRSIFLYRGCRVVLWLHLFCSDVLPGDSFGLNPFSATYFSFCWYLKTLLMNKSIKAMGSELSSLPQLITQANPFGWAVGAICVVWDWRELGLG